ncbi:CRIB domain-containing protein RIC4-like [Oryza brachyantha]|uniref:CRIB domain-containing protein RIC4-like n=1 Tax=Oryza brachyantha TaxID=4533 RepID=UPI001ADD39A0|nr:CRIB domain-containing protein RIC4-like [Oryza brachyantha]
MKDRRGSAGVFPFSIGCMSQSAVDVADPHEKKSTQNEPSSSASAAAAAAAQSAEEDGGGGGGGEKAKGGSAAASSAGIVATGVQRLIKGIKNLSQIFAMYEEEDGEEDEEEREMVIGYPTDVQHVGHIGWDGMNKVGDMVNAFSLPSSLSLRQLEMAMEAAHA